MIEHFGCQVRSSLAFSLRYFEIPMMIHHPKQAWATALGMLALLSLLPPLVAAPVEVDEGIDIPAVWSPEAHVYFEGELPVSEEQLTELDSWLAQRAPNWTVVLLADTTGEKLTDARERDLTGFDAVEEALNSSLPAKTAFGALLDPVSGQPNGVVLLLSLGDQQISYLPSAAYEIRGLGRNHWVGELDQPALRALNNGLRIVDAVKDTVVYIDQRLRDIVLQEQAAIESRRANLTSRLGDAGDRLSRLEASASAFQTAFPNAGRELAAFDAVTLRQRLDQAADFAALGEESKAIAVEEQISDQIRQFENLFQQHSRSADRIQRLETQLEATERHPHASAVAFLTDDIRSRLDEARRAESLAAPAFAAALSSAEQALREADTIIAKNSQFWQMILWIVLGALGLVTLVLFVAIQFSRHGARSTIEQAREELESWNGLFRRASGLASGLYQRTVVVVGAANDLARRGIAGATMVRSRELLRGVDLLWFRLAGIRLLGDQANHRLNPKGPLSRFFASASTKNALIALNNLRQGEIEVGAESAIRCLGEATHNRKAGLLFEGQSAKAFVFSSETIRDELNAALEESRQTLEALESVWKELDREGVAVRHDLDALLSRERELSSEAAEDGLLAVPALFETLIDSAERLFVEASELSQTDPVHVLEGKFPVVRTRIEVGHRVAKAILDFRTTSLPRILDAERDYAEQGLDARWIGVRLDEVASQANEVCRLATSDDATHALEQFESALEALGAESREALTIVETWRGRVLPIIEQAAAEVKQVREQVALSLRIPVNEVMQENEDHPPRLLQQAELHGTTILAALASGNVPLARETMEEASRLIRRAETASAQYAKEVVLQPQTWQDYERRLTKLEDAFEQVATAVRSLAERIPEPLLVIETFAGKNGQNEVPLLDALRRLQLHVQQLRGRWDSHSRAYKTGALFEGRRLTRQTGTILGRAETETEWLASQIERFADAGTALNLRMTRVDKALQSLRSSESNYKVRHSTLSRIAQIETAFRELESGVARQTTSPVAQNRVALDLLRQGELVQRLVDADETLHSLAESTLVENSDYLANAQPTGKPGRKAKKAREDSPISQLRRTHEALLPLCTNPHYDWEQLDAKANELFLDITRLIASYDDTSGIAGQACDAVHEAALQVRKLAAWASEFEVRPNPGSAVRMLKAARENLRERQYEMARIQAGETVSTTARTLQLANQQVELARLESQRTEEIKRREAAKALGQFSPHTLFADPSPQLVAAPIVHLSQHASPPQPSTANPAAEESAVEEPAPEPIAYPAVW